MSTPRKIKVIISVWLAVLILAGFACPAQAGPLEEACDFAYRQLGSVPSLILKKSTGGFTDDGHSYSGCIVRLEGDRTESRAVADPHSLFYPLEGSFLYQQGWRADREADGPDGTSFRISRQDIFCLVEGNWDGGDDSDPPYVPSSRYDITVSCSRLQR